MINLLSNAIKYNRAGGDVRIVAESRQGNRIRLSIEDTGEGIAEESLGRLFTPFERLGAAGTDIQGTGLGLVVSRRLV